MIRRLKRAAKLNRRNRRYRWPWGTGVWRIVDRPGWSFVSEEFAEWMTNAPRLDDPLAWPTITYEK